MTRPAPITPTRRGRLANRVSSRGMGAAADASGACAGRWFSRASIGTGAAKSRSIGRRLVGLGLEPSRAAYHEVAAALVQPTAAVGEVGYLPKTFLIVASATAALTGLRVAAGWPDADATETRLNRSALCTD